MPIARYKLNGVWNDIGNGKAYSKWGGGWFAVQGIKGKSGAIGTGGWVDAGYTGMPPTPGTPWVEWWNYDWAMIRWSAGAGGAPPAKYILNIYDVWGNLGAALDLGLATSYQHRVSWDYRYQYDVYAQTAQGVNSPVTGRLRIGIGHPYQPTYGYVQHVTGWDSGNLVNVNPQRNYLFRDEAWSVYLGNDILVKNVSWGNLNVDTNAVGGIVTTGFARTVNLHLAGVWQGWALDDGISYNEGLGDINILSGNAYAWYGLPITAQWGGNNWWGLGPRGEGWVTAADGRIQYTLRADSVSFNGDRYYQQYELISAVQEAGNYWW
jgi:hypothetical protein